MMVVGSGRSGKVVIRDGKLAAHSRSVAVPIALPPSHEPHRRHPSTTTRNTEATTPAVRPYPTALSFSSPSSRDNRPGYYTLLLADVAVTTDEGGVLYSKVPELASLELVFQLFDPVQRNIEQVAGEMQRLKVLHPKTIDMFCIPFMTSPAIVQTKLNIKRARRQLSQCLGQQFPPKDGQLLYEWLNDGVRYATGTPMAAGTNFELESSSRRMRISMSACFILRQIMYSHNLPLATVLSLWSCYYVLIMRTSFPEESFISQTALWNNVQRLHYIDGALTTSSFKPFITQRTKHGFRRYFYSSSDDSEHHKRNRHVLLSQAIHVISQAQPMMTSFPSNHRTGMSHLPCKQLSRRMRRRTLSPFLQCLVFIMRHSLAVGLTITHMTHRRR